ncbi:MAG: class I SAM-dependent methyltransferase [Nocardioides sp.]
MRAASSLPYRLGLTSWDKTGPDADAAFMRMLDREELERDAPFGRALDLGCGTGAHTRQLRERGWEATGIDNVRRAVDVAILRSDENSRYVIGDVDHLEGCGVGTGFSFYLDMGCFHELTDDARMAMGQGVTALAEKDATLLMLCFEPQRNPLVPRGAHVDDARRALPGWTLLDARSADTTTLPDSLGRHAPQWFRFGLN